MSKAKNLVMATDSEGATVWFDMAASEAFSEDKKWDGNNYISVNTHTQCSTQALYRTHKSGTYILESSRNGIDRYSVIDEEAGLLWLAKNDHFDEVPAEWLEGRTV